MIDIPQRLIRVFDKEKYANSFLRGHVRLGLMQHYRSIEGSRRDDSEGKSQFFWKVPGPRNVIDAETGDVIRQDPSDLNIDYGGLTITPYYILCTSLPEVTIAHFGSFIIQINEPRVFLKRLNRIWEFHAWASASPSVFAVPVTYNKGEVLDFDPDFLAPPHYVYSQKPKKYADEKEWRYVFPCDPAVSKQVTDHTVLAIGDCHDICSLAKSAANTG